MPLGVIRYLHDAPSFEFSAKHILITECRAIDRNTYKEFMIIIEYYLNVYRSTYLLTLGARRANVFFLYTCSGVSKKKGEMRSCMRHRAADFVFNVQSAKISKNGTRGNITGGNTAAAVNHRTRGHVVWDICMAVSGSPATALVPEHTGTKLNRWLVL